CPSPKTRFVPFVSFAVQSVSRFRHFAFSRQNAGARFLVRGASRLCAATEAPGRVCPPRRGVGFKNRAIFLPQGRRACRRASAARRGLRAVVAAFRHRNFRLFFIGQLISLVGTWMQNVAQSWLVYDLTHSALRLGQVSAAGSLPVLFLGLYAGVVTDRRPKRGM